jgi:hypothetical protein
VGQTGNENLHGVRYKNIKEDVETENGTVHKEVEAITVEATVRGISWTCSPAFICGLGGIPSSGTDGTYDGNTVVTGYEDEGQPQEGTAKTTPSLTHGGVGHLTVLDS